MREVKLLMQDKYERADDIYRWICWMWEVVIGDEEVAVVVQEMKVARRVYSHRHLRGKRRSTIGSEVQHREDLWFREWYVNHRWRNC